MFQSLIGKIIGVCSDCKGGRFLKFQSLIGKIIGNVLGRIFQLCFWFQSLIGKIIGEERTMERVLEAIGFNPL